MRLVLLAIQMLILLVPAGAEDPLLRYVAPDALEKLRAGETLTSSIGSDGGLSLAPPVASRDEIAAAVKGRKPSLGVEVMKVVSNLPQPMDTPEGWLVLYNSLHAVSTMKGIPYYSVTRKTTHPLFSQSYAVDPASKKTRIDDPVFVDIPASDVLFTLQEDGSFGKNTYEESFTRLDDHVVVRIENLTTISFLFLPVIQPRNLVSEVILIPSGTDLMFYGVSCLSTSFPLGDKHSREESLSNRLIAIGNWLTARLNEAPVRAPEPAPAAAPDPAAPSGR